MKSPTSIKRIISLPLWALELYTTVKARLSVYDREKIYILEAKLKIILYICKEMDVINRQVRVSVQGLLYSFIVIMILHEEIVV